MEEMEESSSSNTNSNDLLSQHRRLKLSSPTPIQLPTFSTAAAAAQSRFPFQYYNPETANLCGSAASVKRSGIPPIPPSPSSRSPSPAAAMNNPFHSRSLSQPTFFSLDSLPLEFSADDVKDLPVSLPSPGLMIPRTPVGVGGRGTGEALPPRKSHRRSQSGDFPFALVKQPVSLGAVRPPVKHEVVCAGEGGSERRLEVESGDDLISQYMNLDNLDALNSSGTEEKHEDLDSSKLSGTKVNTATESSENEAESCANDSVGYVGSGGKREGGNKRSAMDDLVPAVSSRHFRSLSMDSLMGKMHFEDESPKFLPSPGNQIGQLLRTGSMDGMTANSFGLDAGNGEFSSNELKKIMANDKLAEMAVTDPKRVKRILANRQSAARSKERKMRYISELEHKVQTLQTEATTLSAQLTLLQRDSTGLTSQNNELRFRLQAMEQQAKIREALNDALSAEVHRLKLATGEISDAQRSKGLNQQIQINSQMFQLQQLQLQQQQSGQTPLYQFQSQHQQQQQQEKQQQQQQKRDASPNLEQAK